METTEEKVNVDIKTLSDDIRRVRDDLAGLLRSARHRAKDLAAESKAPTAARKVESSSPETVVSVEEPGQPEKKVMVRRSPTWARVVAAAFALGAVMTILLMRRSKVVVTRLPRHRWRPRFRRVATRTVTPEPAVEETPFPGRDETLVREESRIEGQPMR